MSTSARSPRRGVVANPHWLLHDSDPEPEGVILHRANGTAVSNDDMAVEQIDNRAYVSLRAQQRARARLAAEGWTPPGPGASLAAARRCPPAPVRQAVAEVVPYGVTIMAAQFKAGKTAFALNLTDALGSGEDFLGAYPVDFPDGNVGYWNMEVDEPQFYLWLDRLVKSPEAADRIVVQHLRGKYINFLHEPHAEWTVRWLLDNDIRAWVLDPLGRLLEDENSNPEFNRWLRALESIVRTAGVDVVFIPHHTGHGVRGEGDAAPRARGASAMLGGTDANLAYRHGGELGAFPPDTRRYLSGFGRGVDLSELTVDWDASTGRLYAVADAPGRRADKEARQADKAVTALELSDTGRLNSRGLQSAIGGDPARACAAIRAAVAAGLVDQSKEGRNVWYSLPA